MWRLCFPLLSPQDLRLGKKQICIDFPILPWPREFRPRPEPQEKAVDIAQDLQTLASIAALARDLSPELGRTVQAGIEQAAHSMKGKLPEGVELHFRGQTAE